MPKTIDFIFDFASPNAYLCHKALPSLLAEVDATVNVIPCLLGGIFKATNNQAPMLAFANVKGKLDYDRLEIVRFIERFGITEFSMNPHFPVNTLLLVRGAIVADNNGQLDAYVEAGLAGMWQQGLNMADPEVFVTALDAAGLDGAAIAAATQDPAVKEALVANTQNAVARGAFGIPTFYVDDEMFFGKERLDQMVEFIQRR